jgi:alcohol dehydrogenase (cytochrome c)
LLRKGDNLFTNSILAIRPKTGEVAWYFQMSPNDPFDHDNITSIILADLTINNKPTKVLLQAGRNGFYYVLDRQSGQLIAANPYVKVTWATSIDKETGRPEWSETTKKAIASTEEIELGHTSAAAPIGIRLRSTRTPRSLMSTPAITA